MGISKALLNLWIFFSIDSFLPTSCKNQLLCQSMYNKHIRAIQPDLKNKNITRSLYHPDSPLPNLKFRKSCFLNKSKVSYNIFGLNVLNGIKILWLSMSNFPFSLQRAYQILNKLNTTEKIPGCCTSFCELQRF